jgi:dipeptidyl-peptidase 4
MPRVPLHVSLAAALATALAGRAGAQAPLPPHAPRALTEVEYARAERALGASMNNLFSHGPVRPTWLPDGRFWYRNAVAGGAEYILVDGARRTRAPAFDHERLAAALSRTADTTIGPLGLALEELNGDSLTLSVGSRRFVCRRAAATCAAATQVRPPVPRTWIASPDGKRAAFVRDYDLWVRDLESGRETRLTTDGQEQFAYATNNAGWVRSEVPVLAWSPDSRKIATFQHDGRAVGMMYLVRSTDSHPTLEAWKYPLPGDSAIFTIHRVVIHVDSPRVVRLRMPPDQHRTALCDHITCGGPGWSEVQWYGDGSHLAFLSVSRDHKQAILRVANAETGVVRDVLEERVATQFESGPSEENWRVLPASGEVIWFSERDDWGHLYLYDLTTGELKHQITRGAWPVHTLLRVDERARTLYFTATGREPGRDPYFRHFYRIGMDGRNLELLTPDDGNHEVSLSPDGTRFVDVWSTPATPPTSVLRDPRGRLVMPLERADIARLVAAGWTPPIPFTVKARDGATDLYGLMYRPARFDSTRKYPVVNYLYPGPQSGSVGTRSFVPARGDKQALAELGFIVVELDAMGTPTRSKSFHDAYYGNMGDNGLPDQVAGIRQLGARHPWMDLDRVGIWGHSGGGFASAGGILRYPDFYKVAVSQAGNHDNRLYEDDWGERYQGLLVRNPDGTTNYDNQTTALLAGNLKGKLLLAHGTLDNNVPPYGTLQLVDALIRANKDFDLLLLPNRRHGFGSEPYMMRRRWDYFVKHLMGAAPPAEYRLGNVRPLTP